jgi:hypothetical protein
MKYTQTVITKVLVAAIAVNIAVVVAGHTLAIAANWVLLQRLPLR